MGENTNRSEPFFDEDVDLVKLQFTDIFGQCKMVQMTRRQAEKAMKEGYAINRFALGGLQKAGIEGAAAPEYLTDQSESVELYLKPDASTYQILPWDSGQENVARVICQVCNADGTPSWTDSRHILQETVKRAEKMGLDFDFDFQCEFYLFHTDDDGRPTTVTHEVAGYYDAGPIDLAEGVRRDMVLSLEEAGFAVESTHHGLTAGQHSFVLPARRGIEAADYLQTFKAAVKRIAKRHGLHATFMPKPKAGTAGSGMHINISLFQNGKNIFSDPEAEDGLSQEAKWFMGGIMAHVKGMCAVTNPLVNSYKRLTSGCDAPRDIIWTTKNHNTLLRIPFMRGEDTRIELRFPDPSANAYLTIALCMAAGLDGIAKHLDPGAESARLFASRTEAEKAAAGIDHLPDTLREAVAFMEEDSFVKMVLGQEFVDLYVEAKKAEWNEYMSQVSEWEVDKYLYRT